MALATCFFVIPDGVLAYTVDIIVTVADGFTAHLTNRRLLGVNRFMLLRRLLGVIVHVKVGAGHLRQR